MALKYRMAFRGTISGQAGAVGVGVAWYLIGVEGTDFNKPLLFFFGPGVGAQLNVIGYSDGPWAYFYTDFTEYSYDMDEFNGWGSTAFTRGGFGAGGFFHWHNFYSVNHNPNPIMQSASDLGVGVGGGWNPGRYKVLPTSVSSSKFTIGYADMTDDYGVAEYVASVASDYSDSGEDPSYIV